MTAKEEREIDLEELMDEVREVWVSHSLDSPLTEKMGVEATKDLVGANFDDVLQQIKAGVWDEAMEAVSAQGTVQIPDNPYREAG